MPPASVCSQKTCLVIVLFLLTTGFGLHASQAPATDSSRLSAPADPKALKTFAEAGKFQNSGEKSVALDLFQRANKQDGGRCAACLSRAYSLAMDMGDLKEGESILRDELLAEGTDAAKAAVHFQLAAVLQREGINEKRDKRFEDSCDEFKTALQLDPNYTLAYYARGVSMAHLHQDDAARAEFKTFLVRDRVNGLLHARAERIAERIELARATMAPPVSLVTLDGQQISLDGLAGKAVLIDFWATWCNLCRGTLPHIRKIAQKFDGQPLVVISVSLDSDEAKWKGFVARNEMTWPQYRDGYFDGPIATRFAVNSIPATFSIDADGVLEDQQVGRTDIEGKLKKLIAQAAEVSNRKTAETAANKPARGAD